MIEIQTLLLVPLRLPIGLIDSRMRRVFNRFVYGCKISSFDVDDHNLKRGLQQINDQDYIH